MVAWLNANDLGTDPVVRQRMAELAVQVMETEMLGLKVLEAMAMGQAIVSTRMGCDGFAFSDGASNSTAASTATDL